MPPIIEEKDSAFEPTTTLFKASAVGKKAVKTAKKAPTGRKIKKVESYASYIYKVLKQVHPNTSITKNSMSIIDSFINDIFERVVLESSRLCRNNKKPTLSAREIHSAMKLTLPGQLSSTAASEGFEALKKFSDPTDN